MLVGHHNTFFCTFFGSYTILLGGCSEVTFTGCLALFRCFRETGDKTDCFWFFPAVLIVCDNYFCPSSLVTFQYVQQTLKLYSHEKLVSLAFWAKLSKNERELFVREVFRKIPLGDSCSTIKLTEKIEKPLV